MRTKIDELFENLWNSYVDVTRSAKIIHSLLGSTQQKDVVNDHIALRTFNISNVCLDVLAAHFLNLGYQECGEYHFVAKKLYSKHFEHPNPAHPKVFISELLTEQFSPELQAIVKGMTANIDVATTSAANFLYSGTHWDIDFSTYQKLLEESEFAAWVAAWGFRANHFTVSNNSLLNFDSIQQINEAVKKAGIALNTSGGEIKGTPQQMLEQSSTMADRHPVKFSDGVQEIPSCFYEFARRYAKPDGSLFSGFITGSADKIFESTNAS
ncbi:DUF1338 domain-containing protein [Paraglaciecola arctica]|uniref:2-oxoadipate dioxygenase/decarboxylase n=1 Tax=Paraglaciecola arctica BSs20135 TaxID=493475 RepID=K6XK87_9ALTE|nr:DUF1338 domain-containing protein [Paraglaciecola arctica]GAC21074.1 hypothetical protein GARC_4132 [Paraglaciecola arctica BSs20135]